MELSLLKSRGKIIIVSGGVVESDGENYYGRSQIVEYLTEFEKYYQQVVWSVRLAKTRNYQTSFSGVKILLDIINPKGGSFFSAAGICEQFRHYGIFVRQLDADSDVIVNNLSLLSLLYVTLARIFGRRVVFYLGSDPKLSMVLRKGSFYGRMASRLNCLVLPVTLKLAHGVLVRGQTTFAQAIRWNKNVILSNPLISYKHFRKSIDGQDKKDDDSLVLLFVGKLEENKGVHILIDALKIILEKYSSNDKLIKLHIVGNGPMENELRLLARNYGIADKVSFHGFVDDADKLRHLFTMSSVFVVPTLYHEGFPRVIDEAMASGVPVIASRIGGMKDGLKDGEVFFVEPGNINELADAVLKIITDETLRKNLQESAKKRAEEILQYTAAEQHANFLAKL